MNQQTQQLMDMSSRVNELSDIAVKDVYVRQKLFKRRSDQVHRKAQIEGVSVTNMSEFDTMRSAFKVDGSVPLFHELGDILKTTAYTDVCNAESPTVFLFDKITNGDMSEEERIRKARKWIADYTSGCIGTFGSDVLRTNVRKWHETDGGTTAWTSEEIPEDDSGE